MKLYAGNEQDIHAAAEDAASARAQLEMQLSALDQQLASAPPGSVQRAHILLEKSHTLLHLERNAEAWDPAREAFDLYLAGEIWEDAVAAAEALFLTEEEHALAALGQGLWLAVTFPISPEVTVEMLRRVVEDTPEDSDGAAVAAAVAHYVADLRAEDAKQREDLLFYTAQMLSSVARRHSNVEGQEQFDAWMQRMELYEPEKFLVRLRNVVDVLVQDEWWFDRDALQEKLPVN